MGPHQSRVISKHQNLRVSPDFTIGWDGPKIDHPSLDCVWTMRDERAALLEQIRSCGVQKMGSCHLMTKLLLPQATSHMVISAACTLMASVVKDATIVGGAGHPKR